MEPIIAIVEDDQRTSEQFANWIRNALPKARIHQLFTREDAESFINEKPVDLLVLDIELGAQRNAGVSVIKEAIRKTNIDVLVVSGLPSEFYRGVMKALDAWDYLVKPVPEHDFIETLLGIIDKSEHMNDVQEESEDETRPSFNLLKGTAQWQKKNLNLTATQLRLLHLLVTRRTDQDSTVSYHELFSVVKSGKNKANIKRQINQIRGAFREVDPEFKQIRTELMRGYRWENPK